jgi:hypothetical protein
MNSLTQLHRAFNHIRYYDQDHTYVDTNTGEQLISCTTFIKDYQQAFQKDFWLKKKAKEYNTSEEELNDQWNKDRIIGTTRGTMIHKYIENLWMNKDFPIEYPKFIHTLNSLEFITFHKSFEKLKGFADNFIQDYSHLIPIKLEVVFGDSELGVAGQCDALVYDTEQECFAIYDWKSDKKIDIHNKYQNFKRPLTHLSQCEFNKYSLQLSIYQYLLERNTDIKVGYRKIIWFNHKNDNYEPFDIPYLEQEMKTIFTK